MVVFLLLAMIGVPILEITVFIEVGGVFGLWPTLGAVIVTAIVGTGLLRHQGLGALFRVRESLAQGRFPMVEIFDGVCLLVAGALLLTPGFVTDAFGLLLFVPPFRALLRRLIGRHLVATGRVERSPEDRMGEGATVIDGEFDVLTPGETAKRPDSDGGNPPPGLTR